MNITFINGKHSFNKGYRLTKAIIDALKEVDRKGLPFHMQFYFKNEKNSELNSLRGKTMSNYGGPACVIGYASLDPIVKKITRVQRNEVNPKKVLACLEKEVGYLLAESIVEPIAAMRRSAATFVLGESGTEQFTHLMSDQSTANDAVIYMESVRQKLQSGELKESVHC